jgi:hypothetical protein
MGFIKDAKVASLTADAQKALDAGDYLFTPFLNAPAAAGGISGNLRDWALMIQGIESVGWSLAHWTVASDNKGRAQAYPVFRRRD